MRRDIDGVSAEVLHPMIDMRLETDAVEDQELVNDFKLRGVRDRLEVRPHPVLLGEYEVVDGRRRLRLGQIAGIMNFNVVCEEMSDEEAWALAFTKNHHRRGLNKLEEALWMKQMVDKFALTQEALAQRVNKSQQWVSNQLQWASDYLHAEPAEKPLMQSERQARALREMSPEKKAELLQGSFGAGVVPPSARDLMRRAKATSSVQDVLTKFGRHDDEFIAYTLVEEAGLTQGEAMNEIRLFRAGKQPWQKSVPQATTLPAGSYTPPADDPVVKMYAELGKWYPLELVDLVGKVKQGKTLPTMQEACKTLVRMFLGKTPDNVKQKVLEEFMK